MKNQTTSKLAALVIAVIGITGSALDGKAAPISTDSIIPIQDAAVVGIIQITPIPIADAVGGIEIIGSGISTGIIES